MKILKLKFGAIFVCPIGFYPKILTHSSKDYLFALRYISGWSLYVGWIGAVMQILGGVIISLIAFRPPNAYYGAVLFILTVVLYFLYK